MKESTLTDSESFLMELLDDFPHTAPEGYRYEAIQSKRNLISIWTVYDGGFLYNDYTPTYCIWGYYSTTNREYYAPINSKKVGEKVDLKDTTPYSAMKINRNALQQLLYA